MPQAILSFSQNLTFGGKYDILCAMKKEKITIKTTPTGVAYISCPQCGESLYCEDVESFFHCPYCDHAFDADNAELDDFIIMSKVSASWRNAPRSSGSTPRP